MTVVAPQQPSVSGFESSPRCTLRIIQMNPLIVSLNIFSAPPPQHYFYFLIVIIPSSLSLCLSNFSQSHVQFAQVKSSLQDPQLLSHQGLMHPSMVRPDKTLLSLLFPTPFFQTFEGEFHCQHLLQNLDSWEDF